MEPQFDANALARNAISPENQRNFRLVLEQRTAVANEYAKKLRGVLLGFQARGLSQRAIVDALNALGVAPPRSGRWHLPTVQRVMARLQSA